jgi:LPS export ABC transporter protein LptC/lipopolysaccharide transport protein LptA
MGKIHGGIRVKKILVCVLFMLFAMPLLGWSQEEQQIQGFNLKGYKDDGSEAWDVKGSTANIMGSEVFLSDVDVNAYGDENVNVTAATGRLNQVTGKVQLTDDVVITSERGTRLMTDSLDWDKENQTISTDENVWITDERVTVSGRGISARQALKTAEIREDVTVNMKADVDNVDAHVLVITSDGPMVIDQMKGLATFEKNVRAVHGDRTLNGDKIEIYFDQTVNQIREIICLGNVEIVQGANKTFADKAIYNAETQQISLFGRPKLILITEGPGAITTFRD